MDQNQVPMINPKDIDTQRRGEHTIYFAKSDPPDILLVVMSSSSAFTDYALIVQNSA